MGVDPDLVFVLGLVAAILAFPVLLAAWTHGDSPRRGALMVIVAVSLVVTASVMRPGEYTIARAPQILGSVVGSVLN